MKKTRPARKRKRVAVITGTRAEYGVLRSPIEAIDAHPGLDLQLVVSGLHLRRQFGRSIDVILANGQHIAARVPM